VFCRGDEFFVGQGSAYLIFVGFWWVLFSGSDFVGAVLFGAWFGWCSIFWHWVSPVGELLFFCSKKK